MPWMNRWRRTGNQVFLMRTIEAPQGQYVHREDVATMIRLTFLPEPGPCAAEMAAVLHAVAHVVEADGNPNLVGQRLSELMRAARSQG